MPAFALADALPDFGVARTTPSADSAFDVLEERSVSSSERVGESRQSIEDAVAEAEAALAEQLGREHEEKLAAERARHREEMEEVLTGASRETAAAIAERFAELEREVISQVSALTARILGVALTRDLQQRAVDELARVMEAAIKEGDAVRLRVHGTAYLCDALKVRLGEHATRADFAEAPGLDLAVQIDESLFETSLAEWSEALAEMLS